MLPAADAAGAVGAGDDPVPGKPGTTVPVRPMTFRELLDTPFALIQADIARLAGFGAVTLLAAELIVVGVTAAVSGLTDGSDSGTAWAVGVSTLCCAWLVRFLLRGVTVAVGLARTGATPIGLQTALARLGAHAAPLLIFQLLFTLVGVGVLGFGSLLIISFPAALVWLGWLRAKRFVAVPVLFAEGGSHRFAVARAKLLAAGMEWPTTGLWLYQRMLFGLLLAPLLGVVIFVSDVTGTHRWPFIVLLTSAVLLIVAFCEIVEAASRVVCYINLRCRREGFDIAVPATAQTGVRR
ncbi:hypothetical protein [Nocardia donostiensis]|nr:hypothetical protein [Nocardia donostiensis]